MTVQLLPATRPSTLIQTLRSCGRRPRSENKTATCFVTERKSSNSCSCPFMARPEAPFIRSLVGGESMLAQTVSDKRCSRKIRRHTGWRLQHSYSSQSETFIGRWCVCTGGRRSQLSLPHHDISQGSRAHLLHAVTDHSD